MRDLNCIPYVLIDTDKGRLKFLVDTGSNGSYIHPKHVNKSKLLEKPLMINGKHIAKNYINFNPFPQIPTSSKLRFVVYNFNDYFDGLIGFRDLQIMKGDVISTKMILKFPEGEIPLFRKKAGRKNENCHFTRYEDKFVKFRTDQKEGDVLFENEVHITPQVVINPGLYRVKNKEIVVRVSNDSKHRINFNKPKLLVNVNNFEFPPENLLNCLEHQESPYKIIFDKLRTTHLNEEEKHKLFNIASKFSDCFYDENSSLSFTNAIKHSINTKDEIPVFSKSYRYPFVHKEEVQSQIKKMLKQGIIRHSNSPWSSPVWVVPKKTDASGKKKWRLVIDYRKLNEKTIDDRYPVPNISDIFDKLGRCQYFTTLDLTSSFHQIEVEPKDIPKTAFSVEHGHYEFVRMPFGLKNSPATFQRVMDNVLREHISKNRCLVFMDDVIIYSSSLQEHEIHLFKILQTLRENNLKLQLDKCEFMRKEIEYLGHVVTDQGILPNPAKIEAIKSWPIPKNPNEISSFLGLLGYYRRFIKDFAKITKPMTKLLKKDQKFEHSKEFVDAFEKCKTLLTSSSILQYPDFSKEFNLTTDASNFAIGAVLSQGPAGQDKPIAFASRTLTTTEINYSTIEKELLSIVWACKHFRPYIYGRRFTLYSDHKPLQHIFNMKDASSKLVRWRLQLEEFDYEIKYKEGKQNVVADGLSRIPPVDKLEPEPIPLENLHSINTTESVSENLDNTSIENNINQDSDIETVHSAESDSTHYIKMTEKEVNKFSNQIVLKINDSVPHEEVNEIFPKVIRYTISKPSFDENSIKEIFSSKLDYNKVNCIFCPESEISKIQKIYHEFFSKNPKLKILLSRKLLVDILTPEQENEIITNVHERAHRGIEENCKAIARQYYFPSIKSKVKNFINLCRICKKEKYDRKPYKIKFAETPIAKRPREIYHVDIFISMPDLFLSSVDKFSRYGCLIPIKSRTIADTKKALIRLISTFGTPRLIVQDNESAFKSAEIRGFLESLNIELYFTPSNRSEVNAIVERFHSSIAEIYRCIRDKFPKIKQKQLFQLAVAEYNSTIHSETNYKPIELFFGSKENGSEENLEKILENQEKFFDEIVLKMEKKKNEKLAYQNQARETEPKLEENQTVFLTRPGIKSKTKPKFDEVRVASDRRKTFIDEKNRLLHKENLRRISKTSP